MLKNIIFVSDWGLSSVKMLDDKLFLLSLDNCVKYVSSEGGIRAKKEAIVGCICP